MQSDINSPWYIFNDFMVRNVTEEEALSFPGTWKVRVDTRFVDKKLIRPRCPRSSIWNELTSATVWTTVACLKYVILLS